MSDSDKVTSIGILGGTGKEGKGLAVRWARAGHAVWIGSRLAEKAQETAQEISRIIQNDELVHGDTNANIASVVDVVVLTVPYSAHQATLEGLREALQGKVLIDVTVPLVPPKVTRVQMPADGSAAQEAQRILGPGVQVVAAFQNISYEHLLSEDEILCDVLVCGGNKAARTLVLGLVKDAGLTGWDAGPLENSVVVEGMTSILIGINKQFGIQSAGIQITGIPR